MSTSGTYTFNVTRDDIITDALTTCGVIDATETITTADKTRCSFVLNILLKSLPIETWLLWCYTDVAVPLTSGTSTYTIGPSGDVVGVRPLRIAKGWLRNTNVTPNVDQPMTQLARTDYDMLTPKQTPGIPVNFYYDPQLTNGVLYTWPVINTSGYTVYLSCQRTIQDVASTGSASTETFDLPQEWFQPLRWILADEISHEYVLNLQKVQMIRERAEMWREKMSNYSREEPSLYFTPNFQGMGQ